MFNLDEFFGVSPVALITAVSVFALVCSVWFIGTTVVYIRRTRREKKIADRLNMELDASSKVRTLRLWHNGRSGTTTVLDQMTPGLIARWLERTRSGLNWGGPVATLALFLISLMLVGFILAYVLTQNIVVAAALPALLPFVINFIVASRTTRKEALFERQLADALGVATRSLRAGQPLMAAFQVIVEELEPPVSLVFAEIIQQQQLGKNLEESIRAATAKSHSDDMKLFAASTIIQMRSGGNMADMMDRLVAVIRDRIRLQRRVRVLTSQAQFSKRVLIAIPFILILMLLLSNADYLAPLVETEMGRILLGLAVAFLVVGSWVMNKMTVLKY